VPAPGSLPLPARSVCTHFLTIFVHFPGRGGTDANVVEMEFFISEIARHLLGQAPAIRLLFSHVIGASWQKPGRRSEPEAVTVAPTPNWHRLWPLLAFFTVIAVLVAVGLVALLW